MASVPLLGFAFVHSIARTRTEPSPVPLLNGRYGLLPAGGPRESGLTRYSLDALDNSTPLRDVDQDLLPDALEWVLLSNPTKVDSDRDGVDDFMEALQHTSPRHANKSLPAAPRCRVLINTTGEAKERRFWLHLLAQLPSGKLTDLKGLTIYLTINRTKVSLDALLPSLFAEIKGRFVKDLGYLVRLSFELPLGPLMSGLRVTAFGAATRIGNQQVTAGTLLLNLGNYHSVSIFNNKNGLALTTAGPLENENPYWSLNKICVMELSFEGMGPGWLICEVDSADCELESGARCTSNCAMAEGLTFFLPDGLQLAGS